MCFRARVPGDLTSCTLAPRSPVCPGLVTMLTTSFRKVFRSHGEFCSTQPWEVIVATLTFLVCILTVWGKHGEQHQDDSGNQTSVSSSPGSESPPWTLMELVEVGPRLSSLWQIPEDANYTVSGNYSTMILSDYIEISSNLFRQEIAWMEMGETSKMSYSTDLLWTNEHLAHR